MFRTWFRTLCLCLCASTAMLEQGLALAWGSRDVHLLKTPIQTKLMKVWILVLCEQVNWKTKLAVIKKEEDFGLSFFKNKVISACIFFSKKVLGLVLQKVCQAQNILGRSTWFSLCSERNKAVLIWCSACANFSYFRPNLLFQWSIMRTFL